MNEQYVTEFYRGITGGTGGGEEAPSHRMPDQLADSDPEATFTYPVAEDQTERYAEASGDHNAFHLDEGAARAAGLPGIIVHGLCLMAFAGRAVLESGGTDDPVESAGWQCASRGRCAPATRSPPGSVDASLRVRRSSTRSTAPAMSS